MVESDDLNPPTDLRVRSSIAREGRIASSSQGVVLPGDRSGGGLQHWRMCDEETMGNFQRRGLQKTWASFLVTREAAPIYVRVRPVSVHMTLSKCFVVSQVTFDYIFPLKGGRL